VLLEINELALCAQHFQAALDHFQQFLPSGPVADPNALPTGFDAMQILVLADLYNALNEPIHAINAVRSGTRWLQGRGSQKFWDACEDDREYDLPPESMDEAVQLAVSREGEPQPGLYALDVNARHRLAIARIKSGDVEEGKVCVSVVLKITTG
jgi:general transcription factor 3C polypeptide 3 (transcription factor C subunit 4)